MLRNVLLILFAVAVLGSIAALWLYRFNECRDFGHTLLYCLTQGR